MSSENQKNKIFKLKINNIPESPGVYIFKDKTGRVLYVGKAKNLKKRLKQYIYTRIEANMYQGRIYAIISRTQNIDLINTHTDIEALLLELNLIKKYKPKYNINLKDDKSYPYIIVSNEPFPRVFPTRQKREDGSKYFGPYTDVKAMRHALKIVRDIFMIRSCNLKLNNENIKKRKYKVCLDYHIKKCDGPCEGFINEEDYNEMIKHIISLLNGKIFKITDSLKQKMVYYSQRLEFEKAQQIKKQIEALSVYTSKQKIISEKLEDIDVFAVEKAENNSCGMVLKVRDGKVIGKTHFYFDNVIDIEKSKIIESFLVDYYSKTDFVPDYIYLEEPIENLEMIKEYLITKKNKRVNIVFPKKGEKAKLVSLVKKNAKYMLEELLISKMKRDFVPNSIESLKKDLSGFIKINLPRRIECFDISHTQGTDTVASMVVFIDGKPKKNEYRKYKINMEKPDDYLSMREVISRRFKYPVLRNGSDESTQLFNIKSPPDLVILDGGKGQLGSAVRTLEELGYEINRINPETRALNDRNLETKVNKISVIALAKRLEEIYLPDKKDSFSLPKTSSSLKLLQRIRNETHRFAVTYHRKLRKNKITSTEFIQIKGIGPKTAKKLLTKYQSVEEIIKLLKENDADIIKTIGIQKTKYLKSYFFT